MRRTSGNVKPFLQVIEKTKARDCTKTCKTQKSETKVSKVFSFLYPQINFINLKILRGQFGCNPTTMKRRDEDVKEGGGKEREGGGGGRGLREDCSKSGSMQEGGLGGWQRGCRREEKKEGIGG